MASDVIMPQMGESIAEGTITKWLKQVGDTVERDEPLFEISTDKVDAEIPAPSSGTLAEIIVGEGETVEINTVVARIGEAAESAGASAPSASTPDAKPAEPEAPAPPAPASPSAGEEAQAAAPAPESAGAKASPGQGASDVIMPQMGESIAEGTITKWLKQVGDEIERDEPLFEISTDKVDAEIPAPASGTLSEILVAEGETVEINTVVARIGGGEAGAPAKPTPEAAAPAKQPEPTAAPTPAQSPAEVKGPASREERIRTKSSPVVRKIAAEHGIDITRVEGSGIHGRVTKQDILAFIESGGAKAAARKVQPAAAPASTAAAPAAAGELYASASPAMIGVHGLPAKTVQGYLSKVGENDTVEPLSNMRKKIAEHMVLSKAISPHVHTLYEVDMSQVDGLRKAHKEAFVKASGGAKLTYTVFVVKAVVDALKAVPAVNASIVEDQIVYHGDINVGMAVALDWGLIVPVIKRAQDLSMTGIARAVTDLATRARDRKLDLEEIQGSTFSITNPGSYGGLIGFPVISQPNVGILGMGKVEKRVCVVDDAIAVRPKMFISMGYDHRLVDGATAERFLSTVTQTLENFDETAL